MLDDNQSPSQSGYYTIVCPPTPTHEAEIHMANPSRYCVPSHMQGEIDRSWGNEMVMDLAAFLEGGFVGSLGSGKYTIGDGDGDDDAGQSR